ncbi:hypothetical protein B5X24_HaOG206811 [Helicoverpa armigera]|uniref:PH domain-containing protein n=1 Tax=Helicoverpa armigera TaxID=29058 RepID=A0A2W1BQM6_HELAM|nr:hypothetical protein B5X24_HaOG206811 [Helicoverpa armigera]
MMLSPKIQRSVRVNDGQLLALSDRAQYDHSQAGYLHKRSSDNTKWQLRWFILYQNMLFYYESENNTRPTGFCFVISYRRESQRQYELRAASEVDCVHWVDSIREARSVKLFEEGCNVLKEHFHRREVTPVSNFVAASHFDYN